MRNSRTLSYSEISSALTCQARWDFAYGGHLTGGHTLRRRETAQLLSDGRAWGAAVAAWHATDSSAPDELSQRWEAHLALRASYAADAIEQREREVYVDAGLVAERIDRLSLILDHYISTASKLENLTRVEDELDVPLPSRSGKRKSTRYRLQAFLDGFTVDEAGHEWIVENKLRTTLTPAKQIQLSRQILWYAWARQQESGRQVVGVFVDERLNDAPKPARLVKAKTKAEKALGEFTVSHAKDQMTTPEAYLAACVEFESEPHPETLDALRARRWQQRVPIVFGPGALDEAGKELTSVAKQIRDLDSGELYPVRNAQPQHCRGCRFMDICANPRDELYVKTLFEFSEPKRLRQEKGDQEVPKSNQNVWLTGGVTA